MVSSSYSTLWVKVSSQQRQALEASANSFHRALSIACEQLVISWDELDGALNAEEKHVFIDENEDKLNISWFG